MVGPSVDSIAGVPEEFRHVVWTYGMRRLAVLVGRALRFGESVLLVGETGWDSVQGLMLTLIAVKWIENNVEDIAGPCSQLYLSRPADGESLAAVLNKSTAARSIF